MRRTPGYIQPPPAMPTSPYATDLATVLAGAYNGYTDRQARDANTHYAQAAAQAQQDKADRDYQLKVGEAHFRTDQLAQQAQQFGIRTREDATKFVNQAIWDGKADGADYDMAMSKLGYGTDNTDAAPQWGSQAGATYTPPAPNAPNAGAYDPTTPINLPNASLSPATLSGGTAAPTGPLVPMQNGQILGKPAPTGPLTIDDLKIPQNLTGGTQPALAGSAPIPPIGALPPIGGIGPGYLLGPKTALPTPATHPTLHPALLQAPPPPAVVPVPAQSPSQAPPQRLLTAADLTQPPVAAPIYPSSGPHMGPNARDRHAHIAAQTAAEQGRLYRDSYGFVSKQPVEAQPGAIASVDQSLDAGGAPTLAPIGAEVGKVSRNYGHPDLFQARQELAENPNAVVKVGGKLYTKPTLDEAFPPADKPFLQNPYTPDVVTQASIDSRRASMDNMAFNQQMSKWKFASSTQKQHFDQYVAGQNLAVSQGRLSEQMRQDNITNAYRLEVLGLGKDRLEYEESKQPGGVISGKRGPNWTATLAADAKTMSAATKAYMSLKAKKDADPAALQAAKDAQDAAVHLFNQHHAQSQSGLLPGGVTGRGTGQATPQIKAPGPVAGQPFGGVQPDVAQVGTALKHKFGFTDVGGYAPGSGHIAGSDHYTGRALDFMTHGDDAKGQALFDGLMGNGAAGAKAYNVKYLIWKQHIYYPDGRNHMMADRGSPTANHYDHIHLSFNGRQAALAHPGGSVSPRHPHRTGPLGKSAYAKFM